MSFVPNIYEIKIRHMVYLKNQAIILKELLLFIVLFSLLMKTCVWGKTLGMFVKPLH